MSKMSSAPAIRTMTMEMLDDRSMLLIFSAPLLLPLLLLFISFLCCFSKFPAQVDAFTGSVLYAPISLGNQELDVHSALVESPLLLNLARRVLKLA